MSVIVILRLIISASEALCLKSQSQPQVQPVECSASLEQLADNSNEVLKSVTAGSFFNWRERILGFLNSKTSPRFTTRMAGGPLLHLCDG